MGAFFCLSLYGQGYPTAPVSPYMIPFYQDFRKNHDLSVFREFYPLEMSRLNAVKADLPNKHAVFGILPGYQYRSGEDDIASFDFWLSGKMNNITVMAEPVFVSDPFGQSILGTDYVRMNVSGRITNAFIRYYGENIAIQLGRSPLVWGQSWSHSIIHSSLAPTYDHISVRYNLASIQLEVMSGQFSAEESAEGETVRRLTAGHRFTWIPAHGRWLLGFGEKIVYTGVNRSLEMMYLNPFVPFTFAALEGEEPPDNSDNTFIFMYGRFVVNPSLSVYAEFLVDDFQVDPDPVQHMLAYKIGLDGAQDFLNMPMTWEAEATRIESWTYIHHGQFSTWQNREHATGYLYGPDLWSVRLQADAWIRPKVLANFEFTWLEKGANTLSTPWANADNVGDPFPIPPVVRHMLLNVSVGWWGKHTILEAGWSNLPFANEIAYNGMDKPQEGSFYVNLQLLYNLGFDLE
jgi:hypothetical protein